MSKIVNISQLSVGSIPYKIYSADWTVGFANRPSELTVDFIDENTDFNAPELSPSYDGGFPFKVGSVGMGDYHLVGTELNQNKTLTTLQARFVDQSSKLDRMIVMLIGQTGFPDGHADGGEGSYDGEWAGKLKSDSVIFVGKEIDICAQEDIAKDTALDPCNPCEVSDDNAYLFRLNCIEKESCKRKRYDYSLNELLKAMPLGYSMGTVKLTTGDKAYRVNYTGTLRQVLNNFCTDLGLSFYFYEGKLNFFDLRLGIPIDDNKVTDLPDLITQKRIKKTLDGTRANAGVGYFGRDCEERGYECGINTCKRLRLQPLQLEDVLDNALHFDKMTNMSGALKKQWLTFACALTKVDVRFRQLVMWGSEDIYELRTGADVEGKEGTDLHVYNGMKILKAYHKDSGGTERNRYFELLRLYVGEDYEKQNEAKKKGMYFILAKKNAGIGDKILRSEESLARNFLGRYWYRHYKERHNNAEYNYLAPDGSVSYFDYRSPISLPFMDEISEMYDNVLQGDLFTRDTDAGEEDSKYKTQDTFVLMDRQPAWMPIGLEEEHKKLLGTMADRFLPHEVSLNQKLNFSKEYEDYDEKEDFLFVVNESMDQGDEEALKISVGDPTTEDHPLEIDNVMIDTEMCGKNTTYGLRDAKCTLFKAAVGEVIIDDFHTPAQVFEEDGSSKAGYIIVVGKTNNDGIDWRLNKVEVFGYAGFPSLNDPYSSIDMTMVDITREDFKYIIPDASNTCKLDIVQISDYFKDYVGQFSYVDPIFEERSYTVVGIPDILFDPGKGVSSASFRIGSGGVQTTVNFNNKSPARLSPDVVMRRLQHMELRKYKQYNIPSTIKAGDDESNNLPTIEE